MWNATLLPLGVIITRKSDPETWALNNFSLGLMECLTPKHLKCVEIAGRKCVEQIFKARLLWKRWHQLQMIPSDYSLRFSGKTGGIKLFMKSNFGWLSMAWRRLTGRSKCYLSKPSRWGDLCSFVPCIPPASETVPYTLQQEDHENTQRPQLSFNVSGDIHQGSGAWVRGNFWRCKL